MSKRANPKSDYLIKRCIFPDKSAIKHEVIKANFNDAYCLSNASIKLNALNIYISMVNRTPKWINSLLSIRNKFAKIVGLKDVGNLGGLASDDHKNRKYRVGDKLDLFHIDSLTENEIILVLNDSHLDIKLSIFKSIQQKDNCIFISTIVTYNNSLGRIYMNFIKPFHKIIVRSLLANLKLFIDNKENRKRG